MGNEQKQENLNNQNIQEQEPKQMMPYVDNQDMKERATRFWNGWICGNHIRGCDNHLPV